MGHYSRLFNQYGRSISASYGHPVETVIVKIFIQKKYLDVHALLEMLLSGMALTPGKKDRKHMVKSGKRNII